MILGLTAYFTRAYWLPNPVDLCFSGETDIKLEEAIPWAFGKTDVLFAFDQSGSMAGMIDGAKADATTLMKTISSRLGSEHFGVAGFSDYIDFPYRLYQPISGDIDQVQTAIDSLALAHGGDAPEAYARVIYESYTDTTIAWREDAKRYLVIFGDSYPHDPDAGRDGKFDTNDDLVLSDVFSQMQLRDITLIYVADPGISGNTDLLNQWDMWTGETKGITIRCINP